MDSISDLRHRIIAESRAQAAGHSTFVHNSQTYKVGEAYTIEELKAAYASLAKRRASLASPGSTKPKRASGKSSALLGLMQDS